MKKNYPVIRISLLLLGAFFNLSSNAQTSPAAQPFPYSQLFSIVSNTTVLPAGLQGWNLGTSATTAFRTTIPTGNLTMIASSSASIGTGGVHNYNGKVGILSSATNDPSICLAINTLGYRNIRVNFDAMTIRNPFDGGANTFINGFDLQYRTGNISGAWTSVSGNVNGVYQNNSTQQILGTTPQNLQSLSLTLPAACDSQSVVYLRWVERDISGSGSRASFAIDNISICSNFASGLTITGPSAFCTAQTAYYKVTAIINGGSSPSYSWKKNGTTIGINSSSLEYAGPLVATDQVSCVMTVNGACSTTATSNIITIGTVGTPPTISSAVVSNVSCAGARNGAIDITVTGGSPPYNAFWDTINTTNGALFGVTLGPKICPSNPYCGIGTLGNTASLYIDGADAKNLLLTRGITYTFVVSAGHPFHVSSDSVGGNSNFIVNGQTGAPTVAGNVILKTNDTHPSTIYYPCALHTFMGYKIFLQPGYNIEDPTNLKIGKYTVIVRDANGCTATASYTIGQNNGISAAINGSTDATCFGEADGTIDAKPSGGTAPFRASGTGPTFTVIAETKNHSHPEFGSGSSFGFTIDGVQGKELTLMRGITYAFSAITPGHPFFISTSSVGGNASSEVTDGVVNSMVTNGTLFFTPNATHPNLLYYQCGNHGNMGWKINIVDQLPDGDLGNCMAGNYSIKIFDAAGCSNPFVLSVDIAEPSPNTFYYDGDGDTYGTDAETALGCVPPPGFEISGGDCADNDPSINPGTTEICGNGIDDNCNNQIDEGCSSAFITLNLKMYINGFYSGGGMMLVNGVGSLNNLDVTDPMYSPDPDDVDDVTITAMDEGTFSPVASVVGRLKTNGNISVNFTDPVVEGKSYYINLTHRNLIQTWSKSPVLFSSVTSYDFTTASTQAWDDGPLPMKEVEPGVWACFNGDIDQDEAVTSLDMTAEENASNIGGFGYYATDLDGDGGNTSLDMTIIENNTNSGVFSAHP